MDYFVSFEDPMGLLVNKTSFYWQLDIWKQSLTLFCGFFVANWALQKAIHSWSLVDFRRVFHQKKTLLLLLLSWNQGMSTCLIFHITWNVSKCVNKIKLVFSLIQSNKSTKSSEIWNDRDYPVADNFNDFNHDIFTSTHRKKVNSCGIFDIRCPCGLANVGKTSRHFKQRISER